MAEYVYTIAGKSKEEPKNLPEGLIVTKHRQLVKESIGLVYVAESLNTGFLAYLSVGERNVTMPREDVVKLRDALNRILDEPAKRRVIKDAEDPETYTFRWFEVALNVFVYGISPVTAMSRYENFPRDGKSLEFIRDSYGIHSVSYQEA